MFSKIIIFTMFLAALPGVGYAASCSTINLNRCLDSVCAINVATNPAARCQYCGTADAGTPPKSNMRNISVGQSSKTTITEKELKNAPDDPGLRYAWAKVECFKKIANCGEDDTEKYEEMIQQSCDAVGIVTQKDALAKKAAKPSKKTKSVCQDDITLCMLADTRCGADWSGCADDAEFDNFFATCSIESTGCDEFTGDIRTQLGTNRKTSIATAAERITQIAKTYQNTRQDKLNRAKSECANNKQFTSCVESVCANVMPEKCASPEKTRRDAETNAANNMCKFYKLACDSVEKIKL